MKSYIVGTLAILGIGGLLFAAVHFGALGSVSILAGNASVDQGNQVQSNLIGRQAPFFDLPDVTGNHVKVSDFIDMPLAVVFWSTWNDAAADQMHILDQYLASHVVQAELVKIIAIDSQEERSIVSSFLRRGGYTVPTLVDSSGATSESYKIKSLPTTYFIDRSGVIQDAYAGVLNEKMLAEKIERIVQ